MPITTFTPKIEREIKPERLTPKQVQYYCSHTGELAHSQIHKAILFVEHNCIVYDFEKKCYWCLHLEGYNTTDYKLERCKVGYKCECQFCKNKIRDGLYNPEIEDLRACSHLMALHFFWKLKHYNEGKYEV